MANDTRSSRKNKEDEIKSSKGMHSSGNETATPVLRRSGRETPLKRTTITSLSSTRKSERLEKEAPISPPLKRKCEGIENQKTPSPLRRSSRGNKQPTSTTLVKNKSDKSPGSSDITRKNENSGKSTRQLTTDDTEFNQSNNQDSKYVQVEKKRLSARSYMQLFIQQKKRDATAVSDHFSLQSPLPYYPGEQLGQQDKLPKGDNTVVGAGAADNMRKIELLDSRSNERTLDGIDLVDDVNDKPFKKSKNAENVDFEPSEVAAGKDGGISQAEMSHCVCDRDESCVSSSIKQRLEINLQKHEICCSCEKRLDPVICSTITPKGTEEAEVTGTISRAENCNTNLMQIKPHNFDENSCVICKLGGKLLCCGGKGCKRSYHVSCLNPPMEEVPPGTWYCLVCVKKKIETDVQSVSVGIESIWDAREAGVSDSEGPQKQKLFFVKYKGLAHIHNQWITESQLLLEAPSLVAKFNRKKQATKWKQEWTMPHRLLKKRLVESHCEWLVKWRDLDYEHATWELANTSVFNTPEAETLKKEYESRREKAKIASYISNVDKVPEPKKGPLIKLLKLPDGGVPGSDINHLNSINKLRQYWHKGLSAVVFEDLNRTGKVISFVLSLQSDLCRPFLIISASSALSMWEAEFLRLAPSINVVVYSGNKDIRKIIWGLELFEEGRIMFEVLLSSPEAIVEDLEQFECLRWEAVIIDDWHHSRMSTHFERIKLLATGFRLLYVSSLLKDTSTSEYLNMLSLLENGCDTSTSAGVRAGESYTISTLKDRLSRHIAYECKSDSSKFAEYWVPVHISDVQLEQYCATLLSNSTSLCSCTKSDVMGSLREILSSVRKCCDHPYLLDSSLQALMIKDLPAAEYLNVGIRTSGKLQVLEKMLTEIKYQGLRVLILFQAIGGYGPDSIGSYLDDFIRQRYGQDSYELIDGGGLIPSRKKQTALNNFNKESGRFVFLLENRACHASIKLSSVDCIIIFDSDWNPINDLRSLQKITLESKSASIKLFRLYSSCTVEEKVLILAKQDANLDSSLHNIHCSCSHMLLMWGALYMFKKCDEFRDCTNNASFSCVDKSSGQSLLKDVIQEFTAILSHDGENMDGSICNTILKVQQNGGTYAGNDLLLGERKVQSTEEELPHVFWKKLLEGRQPRWKYLSGSSQRNRKRVHYNENLTKDSEFESDEVVKKRKKVTNNNISLPSIKHGLEVNKVVFQDNKGTPANYASQAFPKSSAYVNGSLQGNNYTSTSPLYNTQPESEAHLGEPEELRRRRDAQKNLYFILKPEIFKLCEVLEFKEGVKDMVGKLLEYIMDNHHVDTESSTILHAFQLSLCWIASYLKKHDIDRKYSLALAKHHLNFGCKEEEVDCIYSILYKKLCNNGSLNIPGSPIIPVLLTEDATETMWPSVSQLHLASNQKVKIEVEDVSVGLTPEIRRKEKENLTPNEQSQKNSCKRISNLLQSQSEEAQEVYRIYEEQKVKLLKEFHVELAVVRSIHSHHPLGVDKMKTLEETYEKKLKEQSLQLEMSLQNLKEKHMAARNKEQMKSLLVEEVSPWPLVHSLSNAVFNKSVQGGEHWRKSVDDGSPGNVASLSSHVSANQITHGDVPSMSGGKVGRFGITEAVSSEASLHGCSLISAHQIPYKKTDETDTLSSERVKTTGSDQENRPGKVNDISEFPGYLNPSSLLRIRDTNELLEEGEISEDEHGTSHHIGLENGQVDREENEQSLAISPSLQPMGPIPTEGLNEDNDASLSKRQISTQEVEVVELQPVDDVSSANHEAPGVVLAVQSNEEAVVMVSTVEPDGEAPHDDPDVLLGPSSCPPQSLNTQAVILSLPFNQEVSVNDTVVQLRISSCTDLPASCQDHINLPLASGNDFQGNQSYLPFYTNQPNPLSHCASVPDQSTNEVQVVEPVVQLQLSQSLDLPSSGLNQLNLPTLNGTEYYMSSEGHLYGQNSQTPTTAVHSIVEHLNQTSICPPNSISSDSPVDTLGGTLLSHTRTMPVISDISNRSIQTTATAPILVSRLPHHAYHDPLQNESERIRREMEQTIKNHEEAKMRVRSDCEKEIEEIVAQIRRKHESILQDMEAQFILKKQELDTNHKKVYMNKMLAEAFRSKCMDPRVSGKQGLTQHLTQLPSQQHMPRPPIVARPSTVSIPALRPWISTPPRPPLPSPSSLSRPVRVTQSTAPRPSSIAVPSSVGLLAATTQTTASLVQHVQNSTALFSSPPIRPLQISTITPPTVNIQVGNGFRAPAPHLHPFRPSAISLPPNSLTSLPRMSPNHHSPINPLDNPSRLSTRHLPSSPSAHGPNNKAHLPETMGDLQALHDSAGDLLRDIENRSGGKPANCVPSISELGSNLVHLDVDLSLFGKGPSTQVNSTPAGLETDIVCLSDDE